MHFDGSCACTALRKASRAVTRLYDEALAESGLTIVQFSLLRNIGRSEPLALSRLADLMVMDRTSLYRTLAPLERDGLIRLSTAEHGRAKLAALTEAGRAAMAGATPAWEAAQARMVASFGERRWDELHGALAAVVAATQGNA
jgi:DNA-binding MarR family transcriptional regulator